MALRPVTPPARDAVSLARVKEDLRVDSDEQDALIEGYLLAAIAEVDGPNGRLGRALIDQTWDLFLDAYPAKGAAIEIPLPPLIEVLGVWTRDENTGAETEVDASTYVVERFFEPARIRTNPKGGSWASGGVRVRFRAGYLDTSWSPPPDAVPENVAAAILLRVRQLHDGLDPAPFDKAIDALLRGLVFHVGLA